MRFTPRVLLPIPASALMALGWLPCGIMTGQSSAADVTDGPPKSGFLAGNRRQPQARGANGIEPPLSGNPPGANPPALDSDSALGPQLGPTGPTGYVEFPGYGCSGPCQVDWLSSVSCASATSCTAVGAGIGNLSGGVGRETLAEGWDGTSWTIQPTPAPTESTYSTLDGISCPAATACLAVGYYYGSGTGGYVPLAESWNGSNWTIRPPPIPTGASGGAQFSYVQCASASACMAVGSYANASGTFPLVEFWDGSTWAIQTVSLPSGGYNGALYGVSCPATTDCTAVGQYWGANGGGEAEAPPLAESWNGSSWSVQPIADPAVGLPGAELTGVWCSSSTFCIAVGYYFATGGTGYVGLSEVWNGTSWTFQPTADPNASNPYYYLYNLSCASAVACTAVGFSGDGTLAESWDGTSWTIQPSAATPEGSTEAALSDVSCTSATACTAVGNYEDPEAGGSELTLAERWDGANWVAEPTPDAAAVATQAATEITSSSAVLHGAVDPDGATVTNCRFDYGTTNAYGSPVPCTQQVGGGTTPIEVSADVSGLTSGTIYYFQLVVTNAGGTTSGGFLVDSSSFTTSVSGATASTGGATHITSLSATLNGTAGADSGTVRSCQFEYGETTVYGAMVACEQTIGGAEGVPVTASVGGLTPGTTYHFRLVVGSSNGTGYGTDETFTTAGSSPPTVGTRIPFTGWPDVALLSGEINAHGNDVLYGFEYGRSYAEEHFTGWLGHVTSTSPTSVEYAQHGLQPDVRYYARLVAFYQGTTYVPGNTVSFEINPPEPEAAEAPYLEANGGDAEKGFVLRCNPGVWRNAAGFRYEWYGGSHPANTQEYGVTKADIGHEVKCKVIPYQLNGQADEAAALTTEPPYFPEGANDIVVPEWLKGLGSGLDVLHSGELGWEAGVACLTLTDGACALLIGFDFERIVLTELLLSADDPPDRNYRDIAIPGSQSFSTMRRYPCARGLSHTTCAKLAHLAGRYAAAAARATSVIEAFAISRNRTLIARKKKDTQALLVQAAARKVYVGLLADAFAELNSAGPVYAEALHHAHLDVRIGAAASKRLANRPYTEVIGHSLLQRMLRFATRADIKKAVETAGRQAAAFDLEKTLRRVLPTALLERYYATLDFNDLTSLVNGLEDQRALSTTAGRGLLVDVAHARAACTPLGRKVATEAFLRNAKSAIAASYYHLLLAAAQPPIDGGSTVDPYPRCHT